MSRFAIFVVLSFVFLLSACRAGGVEDSSVSTMEPVSSPTSIGATEILETPVPLTKTAQPTVLYVVGNTLVKQTGNRSPEIMAEFPVAGQVKAAILNNQDLFVLDEQGITQVDLVDRSYERLMNFDNLAIAGQLILSDHDSKIVYSAVIEDLNTPSSFATIIGAIEIERKTELFRSYQATWVKLLGLTKDETSLILLPVGQDPEFDRIWLLDMSKSEVVKEVFLQGIGALVASLSPNAQFLVTMGQIFATEAQPGQPPPELGEVFSLYDLSSLDIPTHRDFTLPHSPSHFDTALWSSDSRRVYFFLLPGKSWEDPSASYGLWSFDVSTNEFSQVASISDVDLVLRGISSNGEWIWLEYWSMDRTLLVHIPSGESQPFDIPIGALIIEIAP